MSWVPMYGLHNPREELVVGVGDKAVRTKGFFAQRANGEQTRISARDLNIPNANFRRLYTQRAFNSGPPQHDRERAALIGFNRWWYEVLVGPDPRLNRNYTGTLLASVNQTMGYRPDDPRRIVRLESRLDFARFSRAQLDVGSIRDPIIERHVSVLTTKGAMVHGPNGSKVIAGYGTVGGNRGIESIE